MDLAYKFGKMEVDSKDIFKTICFKATALCSTKMEIHMLDNGHKIYFMVKESFLAKTVDFMKEDGLQERNKDMEYKYGKMGKCTRDNLKEDIKTEKEKLFLKIKATTKENSN
jgi:hypothetical protein